MVIKQCGDAAWDELRAKVGLERDDFSAMDTYPDALTYDLVGAASEKLGLSPEEILKAFGKHWITYTAKSGYGDMMDTWGDNLVEFLENLNSLHTSLSIAMPDLKPPAFEIEHVDTDNRTLTLNYYSEREGLTPMVIGMLEGLGDRFETPVEAQITRTKTSPSECDQLAVSWREKV